MPSKTTTRQPDVALMRAAGEALYGVTWRRPLGRALGWSGAHVSAVEHGTRAVTADLRTALAAWATRERVAEAERHRVRVEALAAVEQRFGGET